LINVGEGGGRLNGTGDWNIGVYKRYQGEERGKQIGGWRPHDGKFYCVSDEIYKTSRVRVRE